MVPVWKPHGMDIDIFQQEPNTSMDDLVESSEPKHMEEEPGGIDIGDLDIFSLKQACKLKEFNEI